MATKIMGLVIYNVAWAEAYLPTKWHLDPSSCLATIHMGRKVGGGCCAPFQRGAGSPSNTMWPRPRPTSVLSGILIHPALWPQYMGQKMAGAAVPPFAGKWQLDPCSRLATTDKGLLGEGAGSPSNTMWPGPKPTSLSSVILIHPTVWPQYINVTDRTDNGLIA